MLHPAVTVVIPARDEAATVVPIVESLVSRVGEVVVVDDGSTDATALLASAAGARVVTAPAGPGKGAAMRTGASHATGEIIVFCDADLTEFRPAMVLDLAAALDGAGDGLAMVKADYDRSGAGGRVTELTARPALALLHPQVAHIAQPLGGEYAVWREALEHVGFVRGYGVDLGLLLDLSATFGAGAIGEVHVGTRAHRNRPLDQLGAMAIEVLAVALSRAGVAGVTVEELPPLAPRRRSA